MATLIPTDGPLEHNLQCPISLQSFQKYLGGFVDFLELDKGHLLLVVNEKGGDKNTTASAFAGMDIFGPAILCEPSDIE